MGGGGSSNTSGNSRDQDPHEVDLLKLKPRKFNLTQCRDPKQISRTEHFIVTIRAELPISGIDRFESMATAL